MNPTDLCVCFNVKQIHINDPSRVKLIVLRVNVNGGIMRKLNYSPFTHLPLEVAALSSHW